MYKEDAIELHSSDSFTLQVQHGVAAVFVENEPEEFNTKHADAVLKRNGLLRVGKYEKQRIVECGVLVAMLYIAKYKAQ